MGWVIKCDCGTPIRGRTDDEVVENAQDHAKSKHSLTVTRTGAGPCREGVVGINRITRPRD